MLGWIQYKGYSIELAPYRVQQTEGGPWRWFARAVVLYHQPDGVHRQLLTDKEESRLFETWEEANDLAFQLARAWIDERD